MSILPWHSLQADRSEERSFEALLDGAPLPPDASAEGRFLADVVGALTAPAAADELAGLERARAAYATRFAAPGRHGRTYRRRSPVRSHPKIATALVAGVLGLGGFGAAAYAGTLPEAAQQVAHHVLGAPEGRPEHPGGSQAPQPGRSPSGGSPSTGSPSAVPSPVGPDATGPAAFGLCTAWSHADAASRNSVAFANLAAAAGGADQVAAWCAGVGHPGSASAAHPAAPPSGVPGPSDHPGGKPTALPSHPAGKPSGVPGPSEHPGGKPTALPSHPTAPPSPPEHPGGKPTTLPSHPAGRPSNVPPAPSGHHPTGR